MELTKEILKEYETSKLDFLQKYNVVAIIANKKIVQFIDRLEYNKKLFNEIK